MYKQFDKIKESKKTISNAISQNKRGGVKALSLADNRAESAVHYSVKNVSAMRGENILQLAKIIPMQNKITPGEKEDIESGSKFYNAAVLWGWLPNSLLNIEDDEDLYIVTHGNTSSIGDANEGEKYNIDYTPQEAATLLHKMLPQTYRGKIWLWACHGSESSSGKLSVADSIMTNLSRMRKGEEGMKSIEMMAFAGAVDGNMNLAQTLTTIDNKDVPAFKRITKYKYARGVSRNRLGNKKVWKRNHDNLHRRLAYSESLYEKRLLTATNPKEIRRLKLLYKAQCMKSRSKNLNKMEDF